MKSILKLQFLDFFEGFDREHNEFLEVLGKHYEVVQTGVPDYIIYSGFGYDHLKYNCLRIFYTGECMTPDFNECDYAIGFDRLQLGDRHARIPLYDLFQYKASYQTLMERAPFTSEELSAKTGFCNFVYSNCFAQDMRTVIFEKLSKYKRVDSGGRYRNNIGGFVRDKKAFQSNYKFSIAFENSSYDGYVTEKILDSFVARTIPIYYGDPRVVLDFNPKAFINVHDFASLDEVVERVRQIDNDDRLYISILNQPIVNPELELASLHDFLLAIVKQPLYMAVRRPHSQHSKAREAMILRYRYFETNIYRYYRKVLNQIVRMRKGISLSSVRTN
jgi:alpha(1,3/1,4) fucosyltransferase